MSNLSTPEVIGWAMYYLQLGDVPQAVAWVQKALEARHPTMSMYLYSPLAAIVRASDRWPQICKVRNLPA